MFGFVYEFNFALANKAENAINDDDDDDDDDDDGGGGGTFVDSELLNREILNSVNDKNNYTDNVNSLNIVYNYCVNKLYNGFQI